MNPTIIFAFFKSKQRGKIKKNVKKRKKT